MFGYVTPCKMELRIKDYEKFKAYYCGLCKAIKANFGTVPRFVLNYDMTFLAILLDSLNSTRCTISKERCIVHPIKKRTVIIENNALAYAAFCNVALAYYKLLDNVSDDYSLSSKAYSVVLKRYFKKFSANTTSILLEIEHKLNELYKLEANPGNAILDEVCHPFAELTGFILSAYLETNHSEKAETLQNGDPSLKAENFAKTESLKDTLYWLGYNLGKWIYLIDAWDDLEKDMSNKKFNVIHSVLNKNFLSYKDFAVAIEERIDFTLVSCAQQCAFYLNKLPINKNKEILHNILQYGLMEKMNKVFKRSECDHEKPL